MIYNFDSPQWQNPNLQLLNNKPIKSFSIQRSFHHFDNITAIGEEKLYTKNIRAKFIPLLAGKINERQSRRRDQYSSNIGSQSHRTLQFQSDNSTNFNDQAKKLCEQKLPSLHSKAQNLIHSNKSCEKLNWSPQKFENSQPGKRQLTEGSETKKSIREGDRLSLKKLNALLSNHQIKPEPPIDNYPGVSQLEDMSKQMLNIFKKNHINPLKIKATLQFYSPREKNNTIQSIDNLIKLLKG